MSTPVRAVEGEEENTKTAMVENSAINKMMEIKKMATQMAQLQEQSAALRKQKPREVTSKGSHKVPGHLQKLFDTAKGSRWGPRESGKSIGLLTRYSTVFSTGDGDMGRAALVERSIPVKEGTRPVRLPPHRLWPKKKAKAERQVQDLLRKGMIKTTGGAWSSPVVLMTKKDSKWCFCVDYRRLNAVTQQDAYPVPHIDESLTRSGRKQVF